MVNDVISDMLTRIRNASKVKHHLVQVPFTKMTLAIAQVLKEENFIEDFQEFSQSGRKFLLILLKYKGKGRNQEPAIMTLKRISKPGLRVFSNYKDFNNRLTILKYEQGTAIISTSSGVMSHIKASKLKKGGEILCYVW